MKTLLGFALSGLAAVWIGCSSDSSPVSPSASKALTDTTAVSIPDANLRREIALLGSPVYDATIPITEAEMLRLTVLKASGKGIKDLTGLEYATNLDTLILTHNRITDVTPLRNLTSLEALDLYTQGGGFDISPLNGLTKLKKFGIGDGQFGSAVNDLVANMPDNATPPSDHHPQRLPTFRSPPPGPPSAPRSVWITPRRALTSPGCPRARPASKPMLTHQPHGPNKR